jgi:hypothetical protein
MIFDKAFHDKYGNVDLETRNPQYGSLRKLLKIPNFEPSYRYWERPQGLSYHVHLAQLPSGIETT